VAELGKTRQLFERPLHPYTRGLLEAFPSLRGAKVHLLGIPGSPPDLLRPPAGCRFSPRCPHATDRCRAVAPDLFEVEGDIVRCLIYEHGAVPEEPEVREPAAASPEGVA
jgi:peptide/nickel transport system ATP-binding protein